MVNWKITIQFIWILCCTNPNKLYKLNIIGQKVNVKALLNDYELKQYSQNTIFHVKVKLFKIHCSLNPSLTFLCLMLYNVNVINNILSNKDGDTKMWIKTWNLRIILICQINCIIMNVFAYAEAIQHHHKLYLTLICAWYFSNKLMTNDLS